MVQSGRQPAPQLQRGSSLQPDEDRDKAENGRPKTGPAKKHKNEQGKQEKVPVGAASQQHEQEGKQQIQQSLGQHRLYASRPRTLWGSGNLEM